MSQDEICNQFESLIEGLASLGRILNHDTLNLSCSMGSTYLGKVTLTATKAMLPGFVKHQRAHDSDIKLCTTL